MRSVKFCVLTILVMRVLVSFAFASAAQSELSWAEINEVTVEMQRLENSDDSLRERIGLVQGLRTHVKNLYLMREVSPQKERYLKLMELLVLNLLEFLNEVLGIITFEGQSRNKLAEINLISEIANNDIINQALKAKLLAIVEHFLGLELAVIERETEEIKDLVNDLLEYRDSPDRTESEKEEFDRYMFLIGPRTYSFHSSSSERMSE
jgi:hypothetical protein